MGEFDYKRVSDPVHHTIGLSKTEVAVVSTTAFQRLRGVKQLGLASLVFPGADYSRFSHSLGVCHVTGSILSALSRYRSNFKCTDREIQLYRLAGLLHDVGHYPFSHATEHAIADHYSAALLETKPSDFPNGVAEGQTSPAVDISTDEPFLDHEGVGKEILLENPELKRVLADEGFTAKEISSIFLREEPPKWANLVSSDLDADRIDYLMRTAHHSGLPYSSIDLPYLLTQLHVDNDNKICIAPRAIRTADHVLLSRYFDYAQVAYHKTVAGFEELLKDVLIVLLQTGKLGCSTIEMKARLSDSKWGTFNDAFVMSKIEELSHSTAAGVDVLKAQAIVGRNPPKLIWERQVLEDREHARANLKRLHKLIDGKKDEWAKTYDIPIGLWKSWSAGVQLTKIGTRVRTSLLVKDDPQELDRYEQAVRVLQADGSSKEIMAVPSSLMSILSDKAYSAIRLYVVVPKDKVGIVAKMRDEIGGYLDD